MLHLALYLFLSNPHHTLKQELKTANQMLTEYRAIDCSDSKFLYTFIAFGNEVSTLADVVRNSSDKDIKKNEKELKEFIQNAKQVEAGQEACMDALVTETPKSKI